MQPFRSTHECTSLRAESGAETEAGADHKLCRSRASPACRTSACALSHLISYASTCARLPHVQNAPCRHRLFHRRWRSRPPRLPRDAARPEPHDVLHGAHRQRVCVRFLRRGRRGNVSGSHARSRARISPTSGDAAPLAARIHARAARIPGLCIVVPRRARGFVTVSNALTERGLAMCASLRAHACPCSSRAGD